ncbi:MAG TPA: BON domain-containing protein [Gammaproteobacteria bacterium]|nr:BON domain-containing protein [Gammaproteobacteria bacterium]
MKCLVQQSAILLVLPILLQLQGCPAAIVAGGAAGGAVAYDRRSAGTFVEDQAFELKARDAIYSSPQFEQNSHINVTSINNKVLLTGQVPDEKRRELASVLVRQVEPEIVIYNQLEIGVPSTLKERSADAWLTTKVKSRILGVRGIEGSHIKVISENSVIYLMGLASRSETEDAIYVAKRTSGVKKIINLIEYID